MITIHLITPIVTRGLRNVDELAHLSGPEVRFTQTLLDRGPASIESEFDEALSVPDTLAKAILAERDGADAIIIDCMGDPGLKPAREVVKIPVLGPAETSMHLAAMLGQRFSVVTILDTVKPMLRNLARVYGVHEKLASIRVVDVPVLELDDRKPEVHERLGEAALAAVEQDDADVVVLGCTGFMGCAAVIQKTLLSSGYDVPVIDPIPATACIAAGLVKARLRHSKRTYRTPRTHEVKGFEIPSFG